MIQVYKINEVQLFGTELHYYSIKHILKLYFATLGRFAPILMLWAKFYCYCYLRQNFTVYCDHGPPKDTLTLVSRFTFKILSY